MSEEPDLPDEVALLWGLRAAPRRGPRPSLTVEDITRAAVEVADVDGLAAVSMARVAAHLGNAPMALYRHVKSKDELLALMADAALETPPEFPADGDWRSGLMLWSQHVLAVAQRHPWYAQLPIGAPPLGPQNLAWLDSALRALSGTGLDENDKIAVVMGLVTYVQGEIRLRSGLSAGYAEDPEAFGRRYGILLARLVDPRRFPALSKVVAAGVFDADDLLAESDTEADFAFGLSLYLDGVEKYIARRTGGQGLSPPPTR
jgi:AcrR family transcriptional regulator